MAILNQFTHPHGEIANDPDVMHVLGFIARIEAPMPLKLLATIVDAQAIERTLKTVRHLLKETSKGGLYSITASVYLCSPNQR